MHRIDGPGATVDNRFTDGDPVGGVQATMVTDDWANDVQEELMSILAAGGVTPVKGTQNQVLSALTTMIRGQGFNAYTTAGTSPAFTLTPSPAIAAYAVNQRFSVKFNAAAPSGTLDVSGKGPKNLKQYDSTGAKIATVIGANQITDVVYDGTDMVVLDPLPAAAGNLIGIQGAFKNQKVTTTGTSAVVTITADELVVKNSANEYVTLRNVNVAPSFASAAGANGMDVGAGGTQTASTWYYPWVIYNPVTSTMAGLLSLSSSAPTLPAGYTFAARARAVRTDATANKYPLKMSWIGLLLKYIVTAATNIPALPDMAGGVQGNVNTPIWAAVSVDPFIPPTSSVIDLLVWSFGAGVTYMLADTNSFGVYNSTSNPPPVVSNASSSAGSVDFWRSSSRLMVTQGRNIYCASNGADFNIRCLGCEDTL